jgi:hypothetical protein
MVANEVPSLAKVQGERGERKALGASGYWLATDHRPFAVQKFR